MQATEKGQAMKQYNTKDGNVSLGSNGDKLKIESTTAADDDISSKQRRKTSKQRGQINRIYCLASSRSPMKHGQHPYTHFQIQGKDLHIFTTHLQLPWFQVKLLTILKHLILPVFFCILLSHKSHRFIGLLHTPPSPRDNHHVPIDKEYKFTPHHPTLWVVGLQSALHRSGIGFRIGGKLG